MVTIDVRPKLLWLRLRFKEAVLSKVRDEAEEKAFLMRRFTFFTFQCSTLLSFYLYQNEEEAVRANFQSSKVALYPVAAPIT
jgi:hypothetical protein